MTLSEFKAWFEGFTENIDGKPNEKQWKRIKARVKEIDGTPVTPIVIERWRDRYVPNWPIGPIWCGTINSGTTGNLPKSNTTFTVSTNSALNAMGAEESKLLAA